MKKYLLPFILFIADPPAGGGGAAKPETDADKIKRLEAENTALKTQVAEAEEADADRKETEKQIRLKMTHGISREQAIAIIERQKQWDEVHGPKLHKEEDARRKAVQKAAK